MAANLRDYTINRDAVKALVAVYGPNEAARQAGIPIPTVKSWCQRFKWKKAERIIRTTGRPTNSAIAHKSAADALIQALQNHKDASTLNLAKYVEKASRKALSKKDPLECARQVRDVASVYGTIFPEETTEGMIEARILIGEGKVTDNPEEILAKAQVVE